jgi:hypothetical protein
MPYHPFKVRCRSCFYSNRIEVAEVNCRDTFICLQCGKQLGTSEVLKKAVETLDRSLNIQPLKPSIENHPHHQCIAQAETSALRDAYLLPLRTIILLPE